LGKPNVGKSSLLNCLLNSERAIVSPEAGTTRDYLKEEIIIKDIPIVLIDTAGLRENSLNSIEKIGIEKSLELASNADLVIYVFDANHGVDDLEKKQINTIQESNPASKFVFVANKADLLDQNNKKLQNFFFEGTVFASCKSSTGIDELENTIEKLVLEEDFSEVELAINNRQGICIKQALGKLHQALQLSDPELTSVVLQESIASLQEVSCQSQHFSDSMLEEVFGNFCIGK
jgi:tRNA modification GTPase